MINNFYMMLAATAETIIIIILCFVVLFAATRSKMASRVTYVTSKNKKLGVGIAAADARAAGYVDLNRCSGSSCSLFTGRVRTYRT
jgi:hypothetical protein